MQVYHPAGEPNVEENTSGNLRSVQGSKAAVIANMKQWAKESMNYAVDTLGQSHGVSKVASITKPTTTTAGPQKLDEIGRQADWAILGSAD